MVFGSVVEGMDVVKQMEALGTPVSYQLRVLISDADIVCWGILVGVGVYPEISSVQVVVLCVCCVCGCVEVKLKFVQHLHVLEMYMLL